MRTEICWIEGPWSGRLAIMPRPRGGDWLQDEVRAWRGAGVDILVSAQTEEEVAELNLAREVELCKENGIECLRFPIQDRAVPPSIRVAMEFLRPLERKLAGGQTVAIHCRQGVGGSALLAACLLVLAGFDPETAFGRIQVARGCPVPDTSEQREWVAKFARENAQDLARAGGK
jgi:protein-tyrosine phosphatase